ncbi:hypothetical protein [Flavobacterium sp. LS2R12]|uniref:hypothetical protein n=1 Tax=unclassified Flavobacterium TaxID=196869 RepID=UPI003AAE493A
MKLQELYKHRTEFTIIGLTGRLGSGCTQIAKILSKDIKNLERGFRKSNQFTDLVFKRKMEITQNYLSYGDNWQKYDIIDYDKVIVFILINNLGNNVDLYEKILNDYLKINLEANPDLLKNIHLLVDRYGKIINRIYEINNITEIDNNNLLELNAIFFSNEFRFLSSRLLKIIDEECLYKKMFFIHKLSCTIRKNGTVFIENENTNSNLYFVSQVINKIIKSRRKFNIEKNNGKSTHIVIDSLKNSLEITFFKERFSAFYMVASKDIIGNTEKRLEYRFKNKFITPDILNNLIELDEEEYKTKDFSKGKFTSPDIENCIQKSDYHIFNLRVNEIEDFFTNLSNGNALAEKEKFSNTFLTREEQLLKLIALINQPGLITPSASERNMQIAYTAKLNSGCISRQVGAVITDELFIAKSIGWNDVAKGHTPCNLRNVNDFFKEDLNENPHYSKFEKGLVSNTSDFKYKKGKINNFKSAIIDYFQEKLEVNENELNGKNCSFCFKTIHNYYEGVSNQVHTRSLHAEENAMLQLTKFGGFGVKNGYLFTTASPCELCSKKAYQLGIRIIFYIDPYPGIAINQIIDGGKTQPLLIPFYGAIGSSYHRLYEPYLSAKDEISMSLELKDKNININQFKNVLKSVYPKYNDEDLDKIKTIKDVQTIINQGLVKFENENIEDTDFNR